MKNKWMEGLVILGDQNKKIQHLINLIATLSQPPITSVTSQLSYQIYRKISWISHHLKKSSYSYTTSKAK